MIKAVISDFDGPVNDSFREGLKRIEVIARINGIPFTNDTKMLLVEKWGIYGIDLLAQGLKIDEAIAKKIYPQWEVWDLVHPVPFVPQARETLRLLGQQGIVRTLLTSRNKQNIDDIFHKVDAHQLFEIIQTRQDSTHQKPEAEVFNYTLEQLQTRFGITKEECIFIGDTHQDLECGMKAGIETLIVLTGQYGHCIDKLLQFNVRPENIIVSIEYLPEWLYRHSSNQTL